MRYGYYLASTGALVGDPEYAAESQVIYEREVLGRIPLDLRKDYIPDRVDGVSIWDLSDGTRVRRLICQSTVKDFP